MNKIYLCGGAILLLGIIYLLLENTDEKIIEYKHSSDIHLQEENILPKKMHKKNINNSTSEYKNIFKETKKRNILEKTQEHQEIKIMEEEVQSLINKTDSFIKENNLSLPSQKLTNKGQEELDQFKLQMITIQNQLKGITK
jgi:hypothetical protein